MVTFLRDPEIYRDSARIEFDNDSVGVNVTDDYLQPASNRVACVEASQKGLRLARLADRTGGRLGPCVALAALACCALAGCQKPNPPLIPPGQSTALAATAGPNADRMKAATADDLVILNGEALRRRFREDLKGVIPTYWPAAAANGQPRPRNAFSGFADPAVDCALATPDGTVCELRLAGLSGSADTPDMQTGSGTMTKAEIPSAVISRAIVAKVAADETLAQHGSVLVRYGIDDGAAPKVSALGDPRQQDGASMAVVTGIDGTVDARPLGMLTAACRTETPASASWQRRSCTTEYGPYMVSVSRDAPTSAAPLTDLSADPELMRDMQDATKLLGSALLRSSPLQHVLPPVRLTTNPAALMGSIAGNLPDPSPDTRALIARNSAKLPWHDLASQGDFDTLCRSAAAAGRPLLILTVSPSQQEDELLYIDQWVPFTEHALLAVVQMSPSGTPNPWADKFAKTIGAGDWGALTATDRPQVHGDRCDIGRVYQSPWNDASPLAAVKALMAGHPLKSEPH